MNNTYQWQTPHTVLYVTLPKEESVSEDGVVLLGL